MNPPLKPIYLLADSQLLFWADQGTRFLQSVKALTATASPKAAYVGASNGDDPQFYSIFEAAMQAVGIRDCRMILSSFPPADESFINAADIILLAGGDVGRGWQVFNQVGLKEIVLKRYYEGSVLMGVSAGAVQLGLFGMTEGEEAFNTLIETFQLVPFVVAAHDEGRDWRTLRETIQLLNGTATGIGIPTGGGLAYYPDQSIEAIRHPLHEFSMRDGALGYSLLAPGPAA